jgi:hypothetical protein
MSGKPIFTVFPFFGLLMIVVEAKALDPSPGRGDATAGQYPRATGA